MSQNDPNVGRRIKHFQITRKLGEGGIGQVYQADDLTYKVTVALKLLRQEVSRNSELRQRFLQEAQIAAQINHPNIVKILDFGETMHGECFLVMEMLSGKTLTNALESAQGPLPSKQVARVGIQICAALYAAHQRNAIHRDLKPDNIYLSGPEETVKVLDFGLAKHTATSQEHALTTVGKVLGTPYFMSPEQTMGDPVDARTDIYSLGVLLFQIATNTLPFAGKTLGEVMYKQVHQPPPAPKSRNPNIEPKLAAVILTCLQKERDKRYQSMLEVARALGESVGVDHQPYFQNTQSTPAPAAPPPPDISATPSWSIGTPMPDEVKAFKAGVSMPPSESQIQTVHVRPKKSQAWLIPAAVLIFIATITLLVLLTQ